MDDKKIAETENEKVEQKQVLLEKLLGEREVLLKGEEIVERSRKWGEWNQQSSSQVFKDQQQGAIDRIQDELSLLENMVIQGENHSIMEKALAKLQGIVNRSKVPSITGVEQTKVFHSVIDEHFSSLQIHEYKRLRGLKLQKLSRINLFAGENNTGKTTLLEAIYLLNRQNDFMGIAETTRRRGKVAEDQMNPKWFIEQVERKVKIEGCFDGEKTAIEIAQYSEENGDFDKSQYLRSIEISSIFGKEKQKSITRIFEGRNRITLADDFKVLSASVFSSPFFLNEPHQYTLYYERSVQAKAKPRIIEFIQKRIDEGVENIELANEFQRFLVTNKNHDSALDLSQYGEGVQRIFFISILFASAANGVLLIDEFENAIHVELLQDFTTFICELAELFNTQVFLTSQSKECIDAFVNHVPDIKQLSVCALVEEEENIAVREFSGEEFKELLEAGNVDLRRAQ